MKIGMQIGLGPGHIVSDGDPAPPPQKGGRAPAPPPISGPWLLWPIGPTLQAYCSFKLL